MCENLDRLRELTPRLPSIPKLEQFKEILEKDACVEYKMDLGTSFAYNLFKGPGVSVARVFISSGGKFPLHKHDETEAIIVYYGSVLAVHNEKRFRMKPGDMVFVLPNEEHKFTALEDTWMIAVTVPHSKDLP